MELFLHYLSLPYLLRGYRGSPSTVTAWVWPAGLLARARAGGMQLSRFWLLAAFARAYTVIFRGTPLILQMVFAYDALPHIGLKLSAVGAPASRSPPTRRRSSPRSCAPACSASTAARCGRPGARHDAVRC